jgi:hypothetical protein
MGKLYNRRDLEFCLNYIDHLEQQLSTEVVLGNFPAVQIPATVRMFEKERQRQRMQLLQTGRLVSDLSHALRVWRACGACYTDANGRQKGCERHKEMLNKAKSAVYWAGERNIARRLAMHQPEEPDLDTHDGECNAFERKYFEDRRNGSWPGQTRGELAYNKEHFGSLDYRGWLNMMRWSAEEISEAEFSSELARLKGGNNEQ